MGHSSWWVTSVTVPVKAWDFLFFFVKEGVSLPDPSESGPAIQG